MRPTNKEIERLAHALSETKRIDYLRRLDGCEAAINSVAPLMRVQLDLEASVKEQQSFATSKWFGIAIFVAATLAWIGKEIDWGFLTSIAYAGGAIAIFAMFQAAWRESKAINDLSTVSGAIASLRFHWCAFGGEADSFDDYCQSVKKGDGVPDYEVRAELFSELRRRLVFRVDGTVDPY